MLYLHDEVSDFSQQVLRTDVAGMPLEWIDYRDAVRLYYLGQVAYTCGSPLFRIHGGFNARINKLEDNREKARNELSKAIMEAYQSNTTRKLGRAEKVMPWPILDQKPYLIVLIRKADVEANAETLRVRALVHQRGNTNKAYKDQDVFELTAADFKANAPVVHPTRGEFLWAAANLMQTDVIDAATMKQIEELHETLKKIRLEKIAPNDK